MEKGTTDFIIVAGNIGAGKTTVATGLAQKLGYKLFQERVINNPYLDLFYTDMKQYGFLLQRFFLFSRTVDHEVASMSGVHAVQDRSIYEDKAVFAKNLFVQGYIDAKDFDRYLMY